MIPSRSSNISPTLSWKPWNACLSMSPIGGGRFGSKPTPPGVYGAASSCAARPFASASAIIASARACAFAIFASCFGESCTGCPRSMRIRLRIA